MDNRKLKQETLNDFYWKITRNLPKLNTQTPNEAQQKAETRKTSRVLLKYPLKPSQIKYTDAYWGTRVNWNKKGFTSFIEKSLETFPN